MKRIVRQTCAEAVMSVTTLESELYSEANNGNSIFFLCALNDIK